MKRVEELGISPTPWTVAIDKQMSGNEIISVVSSDVEVARCYSVEDATVLAAAKKMYEALYLIMKCWGDGILAEGGFACEYECADEDARCTWEDCPILKKARAALAEASGEVSNG